MIAAALHDRRGSATATNMPTSVNSYMLAVGQRPAAMPRSTMPANSSASPSRRGRPGDPLGAHRPAGCALRLGPGDRGGGTRRCADERGLLRTRFCARSAMRARSTRERDERDGERGRGAPDEQRAQVTGVHGVASPESGRGERPVVCQRCGRASSASTRSSSGCRPTSSPRASPAAVTTVRPASSPAPGASRSQTRRRGANSEVASPANASSANTSTNGERGVVPQVERDVARQPVERQGAQPVGQVDGLAGPHDERDRLAVVVHEPGSSAPRRARTRSAGRRCRARGCPVQTVEHEHRVVGLRELTEA